ncbi:MAG: hypothetical protein RH862_06680 [Leptospiraceae bacterium]
MRSKFARILLFTGLFACLSWSCIAVLTSENSKSEEDRKWALLGLVSSPEQNALISTPPTVAMEGYDPALFQVEQRSEPEEIAVPIYGEHYVSIGHIFDIDIDTSQMPGAPEEYETVVLPPGQMAELTYEYDEAMLEEKGLIEEFQVFSYDAASGQWIPAMELEVDRENNRVIARTNHFTPFVITALPQPADGGVYEPPQCIVDALQDPAGGLTGPKWSRLDVGFKYYIDRGYTIRHNDEFYDLKLNESLGISTCNGGTHASSSSYCGTEAQHKHSAAIDYLDFSIPFDAKVYVMYDSRGTERAGWLDDLGFTIIEDTYVETTDDVRYYEVYEKDYSAGSQVTLPGNHYDLGSPNQINTNYFVAVLPQGDWATQAGIDCSGQPLRPAKPEGISLIPGSDRISIVLDQQIEREVTGLIVRRRLQEPAMSPERGEALGLDIQDPGYMIDTGLTEGMVYYYSFFAVTDDGLYSAPLILSAQTGPDDDGDGLANYYENNPSIVYYGGNGTEPSQDDTDSDGIDDLTEVLEGTDPTHSDHTAPVIIGFNDNRTINTIPMARFHIEVEDESEITGYYISEGTTPLPNNSNEWITEKPNTWPIESLGEVTLNLWVRDEAGNVSEMASLELEFPYFSYTEKLIIFSAEYPAASLIPLDWANFNTRIPSGIGPSPDYTEYAFGQGGLLAINGTSIRFLSEDGQNEIFTANSPLPDNAVVDSLDYDADDDFWILSYHLESEPTSVDCDTIWNSQCFVSLRINPSEGSYQVVDTIIAGAPASPSSFRREGQESNYDSNQNRLSIQITRVSYYNGGFVSVPLLIMVDFSNDQFNLQHLVLDQRFFWPHPLPTDPAFVPNFAFAPDDPLVVMTGTPATRGENGLHVMRRNTGTFDYFESQIGNVWQPLGTYLPEYTYESVGFLSEDRLLAVRVGAVDLLAFDTTTGAISFIKQMDADASITEGSTLEISESGDVAIILTAEHSRLLMINKEREEIWRRKLIGHNPAAGTRGIAFLDRKRGNQPPSMSFGLARSHPVVTPAGLIFPFTGMVDPGQECYHYGTFWGGYDQNPTHKWQLAEVKYRDPDHQSCGVGQQPASISIVNSSTPTPSSLEIPFNLHTGLNFSELNAAQQLTLMETLVGDQKTKVCPGVLEQADNSGIGIPITAKDVGDYSITVQATDSRGSCEGSDQTARATLTLKARERIANTESFHIRSNEYPEPRSDMEHFSLEYNPRTRRAQDYTHFQCRVHSVACIRIGHLFLCGDNTHLSAPHVAKSSEAKCGPPLFFLKRWTSRTGVSAPLQQYKPLYKYHDKANHYWNESWDTPAFDPFPTEDKRGFLFIQTEQFVLLERLYYGKWMGFQEP